MAQRFNPAGLESWISIILRIISIVAFLILLVVFIYQLTMPRVSAMLEPPPKFTFLAPETWYVHGVGPTSSLSTTIRIMVPEETGKSAFYAAKVDFASSTQRKAMLDILEDYRWSLNDSTGIQRINFLTSDPEWDYKVVLSENKMEEFKLFFDVIELTQTQIVTPTVTPTSTVTPIVQPDPASYSKSIVEDPSVPFETRLGVINTRIDSIEEVILKNPAQILEVTLLRKDVEGMQNDLDKDRTSLKTDLEAFEKNYDRNFELLTASIEGVLELNKWVIGATLLAVFSLVFSNFLSKTSTGKEEVQSSKEGTSKEEASFKK